MNWHYRVPFGKYTNAILELTESLFQNSGSVRDIFSTHSTKQGNPIILENGAKEKGRLLSF